MPPQTGCIYQHSQDKDQNKDSLYTLLFIFGNQGVFFLFIMTLASTKIVLKKTFEAAVHLQTTLQPFLKLLTFTLSYPF